MKKSIIFALLAFILMAFVTMTASAVTFKELAESQLILDQKMEIAQCLADGKLAEADSLFNLAMVELTKAEAAAELEKLQQKAEAEFSAKVIAYVRPIPTVAAVLDSLSSFMDDNTMSENERHKVLDILAERYQIHSGDSKVHNPEERLILLKGNFQERESFRQEVGQAVNRSEAFRQLKHDYTIMAHDYNELVAVVDTLSSNQMAMLELMADHEERLSTAENEIAAIKTAVDQNQFDIGAALSVLEHAKVKSGTNPDAQRLLEQAKHRD